MGEVFRLDDISMFLFRMYHDGKFYISVADGFLCVQELMDINPTDNIKPQPLSEYKPYVAVGELTVYKHKSQKAYYVTEHRSGNPPTFKTDEVVTKPSG